MTAPPLNLDALVERELTELREVPGLLEGLPIGLTWLRLLAEGRPTTITEIAAALGWSPEQVTQRGRAWKAATGPTPGADGQVTEPDPGVPLPRYQIRWLDNGPAGQVPGCAADALAAVLLAGRPAQIRLTCPATGTPISVQLGPGGRLEQVEPPDAVAIMRGPDSTWHLRDWVRSDCARGLWFASPAAASGWLAANPGHLAAPLAFHVAFKLQVFTRVMEETTRHPR